MTVQSYHDDTTFVKSIKRVQSSRKKTVVLARISADELLLQKRTIDLFKSTGECAAFRIVPNALFTGYLDTIVRISPFICIYVSRYAFYVCMFTCISRVRTHTYNIHTFPFFFFSFLPNLFDTFKNALFAY